MDNTNKENSPYLMDIATKNIATKKQLLDERTERKRKWKDKLNESDQKITKDNDEFVIDEDTSPPSKKLDTTSKIKTPAPITVKTQALSEEDSNFLEENTEECTEEEEEAKLKEEVILKGKETKSDTSDDDYVEKDVTIPIDSLEIEESDNEDDTTKKIEKRNQCVQEIPQYILFEPNTTQWDENQPVKMLELLQRFHTECIKNSNPRRFLDTNYNKRTFQTQLFEYFTRLYLKPLEEIAVTSRNLHVLDYIDLAVRFDGYLNLFKIVHIPYKDIILSKTINKVPTTDKNGLALLSKATAGIFIQKQLEICCELEKYDLKDMLSLKVLPEAYPIITHLKWAQNNVFDHDVEMNMDGGWYSTSIKRSVLLLLGRMIFYLPLDNYGSSFTIESQVKLIK
jgi:hypothetical protein